MGRIFIKTVNGREYRYERIETKRIGKKVVTKDRYLGAVKPIQNAFDLMNSGQKDRVKKLWKSGEKTGMIINTVELYTNRRYKDNTVEKWCRTQFGQRGKR